MAEPRLGLGRGGGNSDTFSNSVDKALGCKLRGISERQQPRAKNIAYANDGGGMDPPAPLDPPLDAYIGRHSVNNIKCVVHDNLG